MGTLGSPEGERGGIGGGGDCGAPGLAAAVGFTTREDFMRGGGGEGRVSVGTVGTGDKAGWLAFGTEVPAISKRPFRMAVASMSSLALRNNSW